MIKQILTVSTTIALSMILTSCDGGSDNPSSDTTTNNSSNGSSNDTGAVNVGDQVTMVFSGGASSVVARIVSDTHANYVFEFGGEVVQIGNIPYTFSESGNIKNYNATPTNITDAQAVNAINVLIANNSELSNFIAGVDLNNLSGDQRRYILKLVTENIPNVTLSYFNDFFVVRSANLSAVGSNGTFVERGSAITFTSNSVTLKGNQVELIENPTVTYQ